MNDAEFSEKLARMRQLSQAFTPSAPVKRRDLFAGRIHEVITVVSALAEPGRHVVLYGERGVGKTSLANLISQFSHTGEEKPEKPTYRINCHTNDDFSTIWRRIFEEAQFPIPEEWKYTHPEPDEIRRLLSREKPIVIVMDEFDRVENDETLSLMADTVKSISDHALETKIVIVGVGMSIDHLIGEHESIQRAIEEVLIPRMSESEMREIIETGAQQASITFSSEAIQQITQLAEGLPHYVHLLALAAGRRCVQDDRTTVLRSDVESAAKDAVDSHSLLREYQMAIQSSRRESLFAQVLAACALAQKNRLGQFTSADVRYPLSQIMGRRYEIPSFAAHLKAFTEADRGSVLVQEGTPRRYTYRFRNPLLQPFALLSAISEGLIPEEYLHGLPNDDQYEGE